MQTAHVEASAPHYGISWRRLDWSVVIGIGAVHAGCLLAPLYFTWTGAGLMVLLIWLTGAGGITLGFHRLLTHRSFKTPKWVEYILTVLGCLAWQGSSVQWVGTHRIHHKHSDDDHDPHSPKDGFVWAHAFWCLHREPEDRSAENAAKDLLRDPVHRIFHRVGWLLQVILAFMLYGLGEWFSGVGISWLVWGICVRTVVVYHVTWFVNSATHTWGYRNYETKDQSTNLWWVALLSWGEGWHNNHHAHPRSAAHGLRRSEPDMTYWIIRFLARIGLARDIVLPAPHEMPPQKQNTEGESASTSCGAQRVQSAS